MTNTIQFIKEQKNKARQLIDDLSIFINKGIELGVDIHPSLINKLKKSQEEIQNGKLQVALIGGFSEGKTSIVSAWLERLDTSTMQISQQESSNEVKVYEIEDAITLIDTPGLYGFKEQANFDTKTIEKYKDITKNYVSEAHIVIYVMNPTNPIKESHKEDIEWLFRSLNLLSRTVFVLGRFDEVADVEEEKDYTEKYLIKKESIINRLNDLLNLTSEEKESLSIVAVAANPFGMGTQHWLQNMDQFRQLSHINQLQIATQDKIKSNGGQSALINEVRKSIISDIIQKQLPNAQEFFSKLQIESGKLEKVRNEQKIEMDKISMKIKKSKLNLEGSIIRYFEDLILQVRESSLENFNTLYHQAIGSEGSLINQRINELFMLEVQAITNDINRIQIKLDSEISHYKTMINSFAKEGVNYVTSKNLINNKTILFARDGVNTVAQKIGIDIGNYLKFKPWGAAQFANTLNGALAVAGLAIEAWQTWKDHEKQIEFQININNVVKNLGNQSKELVAIINNENFEKDFFPVLLELSVQLEQLNQDVKQITEQTENFESWYLEAKKIDLELSKI
jgi:hypothetical protein